MNQLTVTDDFQLVIVSKICVIIHRILLIHVISDPDLKQLVSAGTHQTRQTHLPR